MANTTTRKTTTVTPKGETAKKPVGKTDVVDKEKENLKKQLSEMQAQMAVMMKAMAEKPTDAPNKKERNITFINMTTGTVILKGTSIWEIVGQFEKRSFLEREARMIVNNTRNLIQSGAVYIPDAQFVEDNDLAEVYQNILSDEEIKNVLKNNAEYVIETYKNACECQKGIIVNMIVEKRMKGEKVDNNILAELGELCGKDLINIEIDEE